MIPRSAVLAGRIAVAVAGAGVACGGKPPPPVVEPTAPPVVAAPVPAACIPVIDEAAPITHATVIGSQVRYCLGAEGAHCFALDVGTGALSTLAEPPIADTTAAARVETTNPELKVCRSQTCKTLTPSVLPTLASLRAATNPDGSVAVVLLGDAARGKGYGEIWDVARSRRTAKFRYARGVFRCGDVAMLDDTIYVTAATCGAPAARAALYSLRGKRIANVGGKDFGVFGDAHIRLEGSTWAFLEENGSKLAIQEVAKGRILRTIDTSALFAASGSRMGNPGESALVRVDAGRVAVIAGAPARGSVAIIDVPARTIQVWTAPSCEAGAEPAPRE